jgi:CheY-like chemotaxis protein
MAAASGPRVVLVVDDNKDLRESLRDLLLLMGHTVLEASNGDEALQVMATETVDVVVTDLYMPGLNGMELMREAWS